METYFTIKEFVTSTFVEKKSKFIGVAYPVVAESTVKERLNFLRSSHPQANHICFAFKLGVRGELYRSSDDGEPSGTAGRPILGQIDAFKVTNILVASIRYFGGIELGTGGLVSAYQHSAKLTLENATIIEKRIMRRVDIVYPYEATKTVQMLFRSFNVEIIEERFGAACEAVIDIPIQIFEPFAHDLKAYTDIYLREDIEP